MDIEGLRNSYKPNNVILLLVGESAPESGKFFYDKSMMTGFTAKAFEMAYKTKFENLKCFLNFFKEKQCYLDDLSHIPVDKMELVEREKTLKDSIGSFSKRLKELNPDVVCIVLRKIELHVKEAMQRANISRPIYVLPFPGMGHQAKYIHGLNEIISKHLNV